MRTVPFDALTPRTVLFETCVFWFAFLAFFLIFFFFVGGLS